MSQGTGFNQSGGAGGFVGPTTELDPVISQINNPPGGPTLGDRYLVNTAPTGAWVGKANNIAEWDGGAWVYTAPTTDDVVYITATLTTKRYNGSAWVSYVGTAILQNGNVLGGNIVIGTNDAYGLVFKTNGLNRGQFLNNGQFNAAGNAYFGHINTGASARVHIKGAGSTSATKGIYAESASGLNYMYFDNSGAVVINMSSNGVGLQVRSAFVDLKDATIKIIGENTPSISFVGVPSSGFRNWAIAKGYNNGNDLEILGSSSNDGTPNQTWMYFKASNGFIGINNMAPGYELEVTGTIKATAYRVGASAGASGTWTTVDLKTITATNGLITSIV